MMAMWWQPLPYYLRSELLVAAGDDSANDTDDGDDAAVVLVTLKQNRNEI